MGANNADFHGYTSEVLPAPEGMDYHTVNAYSKEGEHVGELMWHKDHGTVDVLDVDTPHRRRGVATMMWNAAKASGLVPPQHSEEQTDSGKAWAKAVGD
jgi:ribosomal protein S18 acetylase RimI-like enzyme